MASALSQAIINAEYEKIWRGRAPTQREHELLMSRIWRASQGHDVGVISGFDSSCKSAQSAQRIELSMDRLRRALYQRGYRVQVLLSGSVTDDDVKAQTEFVYVVDTDDGGKLREDLFELGRLFQQRWVAFQSVRGEYELLDCPAREAKSLGKDSNATLNAVFYRTWSGCPFQFDTVLMANLNDAKLYEHYYRQYRTICGIEVMAEISACVSDMRVWMDAPVRVSLGSSHIPYFALFPFRRWVNTETYELSERGQSVVDGFFDKAQIAIAKWLENPESVQGVEGVEKCRN